MSNSLLILISKMETRTTDYNMSDSKHTLFFVQYYVIESIMQLKINPQVQYLSSIITLIFQCSFLYSFREHGHFNMESCHLRYMFWTPASDTCQTQHFILMYFSNSVACPCFHVSTCCRVWVNATKMFIVMTPHKHMLAFEIGIPESSPLKIKTSSSLPLLEM